MRSTLYQLKGLVCRAFFGRRSVFSNQSRLMDRLSHELRTSLTGIMGYSEFVESSSVEPMINFTGQIIRESSQALARSSNSFFDLYRLESGLISVDCSIFSISDLIRSVIEFHQKQANSLGINILFTASAEATQFNIYSDALIVRQVVDSLVFDAVQTIGVKLVCIDVSINPDRKFINLIIVKLGSHSDKAKIGMLEDFWCNEDYKFKLQEGPGVELALAKAFIYFLKGGAQFRSDSQDSSSLIIYLPSYKK
jgi:two-component system, sensor histidine kinase and response regulator